MTIVEHQSSALPRLQNKPKLAGRECYVYRLYDAESALLYVGVSTSWTSQMPVHWRRDAWIRGVRTMQVEEFPSAKEANARAVAIVTAEQPRYNARPKRECVIDGEVVRIPLANGLEAIVDAADYELVRSHTWTARPSPGGTTYVVTHIILPDGSRRGITLHRLLLNPRDGMYVDHIDGDGLNNRRSNLREATPQQNQANSKRPRTAKNPYKGVTAISATKWRSVIEVRGQAINLGSFTTPEDAARAYDAKALEIHGEFARLNFPVLDVPIQRL